MARTRPEVAAPGCVETPNLATVPDKLRQHRREQVSLHRLGRIEAIAKVDAFLADDVTGTVNGAVIEASGRMTV
jgi:NAD(P)-dependent dehydrogenase (short-subunit alcohol dehydrogenase family)